MTPKIFTFILMMVMPLVAAAANDVVIEKPVHRMGNDIEPPFLRISEPRPVVTPSAIKIAGLTDANLLLFREAVTSMHGFFTYHAERLLREIILSQPDHPIPYAFAAYAQIIFSSGNLARGLDYMKFANQKAVNYSLADYEKSWLEAIAVLFSLERGDVKDRRKDHMDKLAAIHKDYSDDVESVAFLALAKWGWEIDDDVRAFYDQDRKQFFFGKNPNFTKEEKVKRESNTDVLLSVDREIALLLKKYPMHPSHHYKIHLWNYPGSDFRALDSARQCGQANPGIAHLWHMPAHTFYGVNQCVNAEWQLDVANRVDNSYLAKVRVHPSQIHNYEHNFDFWSIGQIATGRVRNFLTVAKRMLAAPRLGEDVWITPAVVSHILAAVESYELWDEFLLLHQAHYLDHLFAKPNGELGDSKFNVAALIAYIERVRILALYRMGNTELANQAFEDWQDTSLFADKDLKDDSAKSSRRKVSNIFSDLRIWREIFLLGEAHGERMIGEELLQKLVDLDISPVESIVRIAIKDGHKNFAWKLAQSMNEQNGYSLTAKASSLSKILAVAEVYHFAGRQTEAREQLTRACMVTHAARVLDLPILERIGWAHVDLSSCDQKQGKLPYMQEINQADFGPDTYQWPSAPAEFFKVRGEIKKDLVIFTKGVGCVGCNEQLRKLQEKFDELAGLGLRIVVMGPDSDPMVLTKAGLTPEQSLVVPGVDWFKTFGAYDQFEQKQVHGIYLVDAAGKMRFHHASVHAFSDVNFLVLELRRLLSL